MGFRRQSHSAAVVVAVAFVIASVTLMQMLAMLDCNLCKCILRLSATCLLIACGGGGGGGGSVGSSTAAATLSWDPVVDDPTLAGYRVYYGIASRTYLQPAGQGLVVGNVTTYTVSGLSPAATYYFAVTAYDQSGNESVFSSEAVKAQAAP